jgi:uncharacterized protein (TIGR03437 family)
MTAIVPYLVAGKAATNVQVQYEGVRSAIVSVPVAAATPGFFKAPSLGKTQAAAINHDGSYNSQSSPARRGSVLMLYATGEGQTVPAGVDGSIAIPPYPKPVLPVSVTIGGITVPKANIEYAGAPPGEVAGLMQLNVKIPEATPVGSTVPITLTIGNASSPEVTIAIQ